MASARILTNKINKMDRLKQVIEQVKEYEDNNCFELKTIVVLHWLKEIENEALDISRVSKSLPTDDELDDAAIEYCKSVYSDRPEMDDYQDGVEAFDAGAIWMKERLV